MSLLVHRCECGHPDIFHSPAVYDNARPCANGCTCKELRGNPEPEVIPTWDADLEPVLTLCGGGVEWNAKRQGWSGITTCACERCKEVVAAS